MKFSLKRRSPERRAAKRMGVTGKRVRRAQQHLFMAALSDYAELLAVLRRQLRGLKGKRILEIGCCTTEFLEALKAGEKAEVYGIDLFFSPQELERAQQTGIPVEKQDMIEIGRLFPGKKFHAIVARGVFEPGGLAPFINLELHSWHGRFLQNLNRRLEPNGLVVIDEFFPKPIFTLEEWQQAGFRPGPSWKRPYDGSGILVLRKVGEPQRVPEAARGK